MRGQIDYTEYYKELGRKIRDIREKNNLTQREIAIKVGVTFQQYQKYERGENRIPTKALVIFCELTNTDIKKLTGCMVDNEEEDNKEKVVNYNTNHNITNVYNYNGFFSNILKDLINDILKNKGSSHKELGSNESSQSIASSGAYKYLLSGVSYMLPFVISGGILIAIAFLIDKLSGVEAGSALGSTTQWASWFMNIGGQAFGLFVPVLAAFIAFSIGNRAALVSGFVGGALVVSGGSGFLGAIIAGFLAGYVTIFLMKILSRLPKSLDGIKSILIYPVISVLIVGLLMIIVFNAPMKFINESILNWLNTLGGNNKILLGLLLGGMMSLDMGGPINKAAYVFGVASLVNGSSESMAAVMAGGMTPPLGIALASTFFKGKFSKEEQEAGKSNYVMGLSFITEGAIPFAASDPLRMIPCFVVGSSIAGSLSMLFNVSLPAPHGGIVVMFLSNHVWYYMLAVLIGAVITAGLVGTFKRKTYIIL